MVLYSIPHARMIVLFVLTDQLGLNLYELGSNLSSYFACSGCAEGRCWLNESLGA